MSKFEGWALTLVAYKKRKVYTIKITFSFGNYFIPRTFKAIQQCCGQMLQFFIDKIKTISQNEKKKKSKLHNYLTTDS